MRRTLPALVGFVGLCLLVGAAGASVTAGSVGTWYPTLARPPLVPPDAVFGPVWTVLYVLIGTAAWLAWRGGGGQAALRLWGWQLLLNAAWTPAFFGLRSPGLALLVILPLLVLIGMTMRAFLARARLAALLMVPYALWTLYATYLTFGFWWLNR